MEIIVWRGFPRRAASIAGLCAVMILGAGAGAAAQGPGVTRDIAFTSHDGHAMRGRLTVPLGPGPHPVVVYAQTAEGTTIEVRRPLSDSTSFSYYGLYADSLPAMGIAFFRYDGRGIGMGPSPPRFETIDTTVFNTGTLDNKVRDLLAAVSLVAGQPEIDPRRVFLMGASEGTLLIADAASRAPDRIAGLVMYGVLAGNLRETMRHIFSDGAFLTFRRAFDTDSNGVVTPAEFEADPRGYRARALGNAPFSAADVNQDGVFSVDDIKVGTARYLSAIDGNDFAVLQAWARTNAAVAVPEGWFADHFAYRTMWSFVSGLDIPIGLFHGDMDAMTPISGVRALEEQARAAGKTNMRFHYFPGLDHSLGLGMYFVRGTLPPGHAAIFAWLREFATPATSG
ncbi:MAG TPA: alpha/beta hydrolase [Longimicrobium sp.]|nr:alpha/beta hydrolase [Longimicrobium sp.]